MSRVTRRAWPAVAGRPAELGRRVEAVVAGESWVIDGNYSAVRHLVWSRADTVIWFDLPRRIVMRQVVARVRIGSRADVRRLLSGQLSLMSNTPPTAPKWLRTQA